MSAYRIGMAGHNWEHLPVVNPGTFLHVDVVVKKGIRLEGGSRILILLVWLV